MSAGFLKPSVEFFPEHGGFFRLDGGEILGFADVLPQVIEFDVLVLVELDEAEVSLAQGAVGCGPAGMIVRVVPIDRIALQGAGLLEKRQ